MLNTPLYEQQKNSTFEIAYKLNGVSFLDGVKKKPDDIEKYISDWLAKNLTKTKFKSVDEGVNLIMENIQLQKKIREENKGLYDLMRKADVDQLSEIIAVDNSYDRKVEKVEKLKKIKKSEGAN